MSWVSTHRTARDHYHCLSLTASICSWSVCLDFISQAHFKLLHVYEKQTKGFFAFQRHESCQGSENNKILFNILQLTQQMFNFLSIKTTHIILLTSGMH